MTTARKKQILVRIATLQRDIDVLKRVRMEVLSSGYASATLSTSGGSRSYTRLDVAKITETLAELQDELGKTRALLSGSDGGFKTIFTVYS